MYGRGTYLAASEANARSYANTDGDGSVIASQVKVKNPYVMDSKDLGAINSWFDNIDDSSAKSNQVLSDFVKAKGHDSIYVRDLGYFVSLDKRQVATYKKTDLSGSDVQAALKSKETGLESPTGKMLAKVGLDSSSIPKPDEDLIYGI